MTTDNPRKKITLDLDLTWYGVRDLASDLRSLGWDQAADQVAAQIPLSGGGVGSPGALPLGAVQREETPTPPPLTVDRERIAEVLLRYDALGVRRPEAREIADAVVAELAAGRTVVDLTSDAALCAAADAITNLILERRPGAYGDAEDDGWDAARAVLKALRALDGGGTD